MGWCNRDRCNVLKNDCKKRCGTIGYRKCDHYKSVSDIIVFPAHSLKLLPILDSMPDIYRSNKMIGMHNKNGVLYFTSKYPNYEIKSTKWNNLRGMLSRYSITESSIDAKLIVAYLSEVLEQYDSCEVCGKKHRKPTSSPICYRCKTTSVLKMCKNYYFPWDTTVNVRSLFDSDIEHDVFPLKLSDLNGMIDKFNMMRGR